MASCHKVYGHVNHVARGLVSNAHIENGTVYHFLYA